MSIIHVKNQKEFEQHVINSPVPVIVDFHAVWCPPCVKLGQVFDTLIQESNGWNIVKLNCDEAGVKDLAKTHKVSGIPAIFFYNEGKQNPAGAFTGFDQEKLSETVELANSLVKK